MTDPKNQVDEDQELDGIEAEALRLREEHDRTVALQRDVSALEDERAAVREIDQVLREVLPEVEALERRRSSVDALRRELAALRGEG